MTTDTERMDFLETLRNRTVFVNKKNPVYYKRTDIHITGPVGCSIYARSLGAGAEFDGHGVSVRDAIDEIMAAMANAHDTKSELKAYPHWVCHGCGIKAQGRPMMDGMSTYHEAKCDVCGKTKAVTQPRDFGYPDFPGFRCRALPEWAP